MATTRTEPSLSQWVSPGAPVHRGGRDRIRRAASGRSGRAFVSRGRAGLAGRTAELEQLAVEMYARGLSTRDIEAAFRDATGASVLSRTAVSEVNARLWQEYELTGAITACAP
jgi:hypothetical protein